MSRKAFLVQVELDVQAVTCPGVWLCSNGKVALQIYMLDSCVQTGNYKPNFPIQFSETFVFSKTFYSKHQLIELEKELHDQWLYIELVQWQSCEIGHVLATFQTTLDELLYPSTTSGSIAGVDLDLLMEPSKTFPGTIAPKVEISTKTTIEETLCVCKKPTSNTAVVNPKLLTSSLHKPRRKVCRKVCHSIEYSRKKPHFKSIKSKPPFRYRKAEDDLILRKPQYCLNPSDYCSCRQSRSLERPNLSSVRRRKTGAHHKQNECPCTDRFPSSQVRMCACGSGHKENLCPVCAKYQGYFSVNPATELQEKEKSEEKTEPPLRTTLFDTAKNRYKHSKTNRCPCCRPVTYAADEYKSEATVESSDTEQDKKRVCFCNAERKPSLAERLHAKLTKTLSSIPKSIEWSCGEYDYECDCSECPRQSRAELYRDLQKFYGNLYEKARSSTSCVPDCPGFK